MRTQLKYQVIHMNRNRYPVSLMCRFFGVSRSGYYDYIKRLDQPAHDAALADIIREQQKKYDRTYGYPYVEVVRKGQGNTPKSENNPSHYEKIRTLV